MPAPRLPSPERAAFFAARDEEVRQALEPHRAYWAQHPDTLTTAHHSPIGRGRLGRIAKGETL